MSARQRWTGRAARAGNGWCGLLALAAAAAVAGVGCGRSESRALVIFEVTVAADVPDFSTLRFVSPDNASVPPRDLDGPTHRSQFALGYFVPNPRGTVTVVAEALRGDGCVVGRGMATATGVVANTEVRAGALPVTRLGAPECRSDGGSGSDARDGGAGGGSPGSGGGGGGPGGGGAGGTSGSGGSGGGGPGSGGSGTGTGGSGPGSGGSGPGSGGSGPGSGGSGTGGRGAGTGGGGGGTGGAVLSAAASHDFGDLEIGVASQPFAWMITNTGGAATGPLQVQYSGARILVASGSCASLAPGASCTLSVVATPGPPGMFSASVTVSDSSGAGVTLATTGNGRYRLTVIVQGTGTVTTTPPGIDCGSTCSALVGIGGVTLHARNTNGSGSYLTGWTNACSGPDRNCIVTLSASLSVTATFSPLTNNLVFVTSQGIPTNKGSAVAYDADCNAAATAAGINNAAGNGYIAFVSDAASPALTRLPAGVQGWIRLDGKPFSTTTSNLFTNNQVLNPIFFNELGRASTLRYALTGSRADGTLAMSCANWTSVSDPGGASLGLVAGGPHTWGGSVLGGGCTNQLAWVAICMGKTSQAALQLPAAPPGARRIWITNTLYTVGSMTPNQKCMAERPAGVTSAAALIATTDRPASAALIAATTYVRVDGTVVGTGGEIGFGQGLRSGIWQSADGTYSAIDVGNNVGRVWTGSSGPGSMGSVETTCNNWTDPAQPSGFQGNFSTVEGEWWQAGVGVPCNDAAHSGRLYCIQTAP